jgi:hypothetical protein
VASIKNLLKVSKKLDPFLHPTKQCFMCGRKLGNNNLVMYINGDFELWLHNNCSQHLSQILLTDSLGKGTAY